MSVKPFQPAADLASSALLPVVFRAFGCARSPAFHDGHDSHWETSWPGTSTFFLSCNAVTISLIAVRRAHGLLSAADLEPILHATGRFLAFYSHGSFRRQGVEVESFFSR